MKLRAQTVHCVDRNMWVRELINEQGDCVAELSVESTQDALVNRNEALFLAAPELLHTLENIACHIEDLQLNKWRLDTHDIETTLAYLADAYAVLRKARGEQ